MRKEARGFTLIEMMIAVAVVAILIGIAAPAWTSARSAAYAGKARTGMTETVLSAVRHSALAGTEVVICAPADTGATRCAHTTNWTGGWMVFADTNGNRLRDANEPIVHRQEALDGGTRLWTTEGRTRLVFQPNGGNAGSNVTFTLCDDRGAAKASTFVLANDGRMRLGTPTWAAAQECASGGE